MAKKGGSIAPLFPEGLGRLTLSDLMTAEDAEVEKKGRDVRIRLVTDDSTLCLEYTRYPDGEKLSANKITRTVKKHELEGTVKKMRDEGMTYEQIGKRTNMSTTYARKLALKGKKPKAEK